MTAVKLYTAPMCSQCIRMKEFLNFIEIDYEEINIEAVKDAKQELKCLTGQKEAPVLSIGDKVIEGFDRELIVKVLKDNGIEVDEAPSAK